MTTDTWLDPPEIIALSFVFAVFILWGAVFAALQRDVDRMAAALEAHGIQVPDRRRPWQRYIARWRRTDAPEPQPLTLVAVQPAEPPVTEPEIPVIEIPTQPQERVIIDKWAEGIRRPSPRPREHVPTVAREVAGRTFNFRVPEEDTAA